MKRRFIAVLVALIMTLALVPISFAEPARDWTVPDGYNVNDYNKAAAFLEQTDGNGIRNGEKLSGDYDPNDPETWGMYDGWDENDEPCLMPRFEWTNSGGTELRLYRIYTPRCNLFGAADFSGCSELWVVYLDENSINAADFRDCIALDTLMLEVNDPLSEIDVTGCSVLNLISFNFCPLIDSIETIPNWIGFLGCGYSGVTELDLSDFYRLYGFEASGNPQLTRIDVSGCSELMDIRCWRCGLTELIMPEYKDTLVGLTAFENSLSEIDLDYPNLNWIQINDNQIEGELDLRYHSELFQLVCYNNNITGIDLTGCSQLRELHCQDNDLTSLDLSDCPELSTLNCMGNGLTELDLSNNPYIPIGGVLSSGNGIIGLVNAVAFNPETSQYEYQTNVCAEPLEDAEFLGWHSLSGDLISNDATYNFSTLSDQECVLVAHFSGGDEQVLGDVNGDGAVNSDDALLVMRSTLGLTELTSEQNELADINGDGIINLVDALLILRTAMGLI